MYSTDTSLDIEDHDIYKRRSYYTCTNYEAKSIQTRLRNRKHKSNQTLTMKIKHAKRDRCRPFFQHLNHCRPGLRTPRDQGLAFRVAQVTVTIL